MTLCKVTLLENKTYANSQQFAPRSTNFILCSGTVDRWGKSQNCYFEYIHEHELWLGESNSIFNVLLGGPQQFLKHLSSHIFMIAI